MKKTLIKSEEVKLDIIENFIDWFTTNDNERDELKRLAFDYVTQDHVNELEDYIK